MTKDPDAIVAKATDSRRCKTQTTSDTEHQIANQFDIRHMNEQRTSDYPPAFLDWFFGRHVATVELTDRLLAEQGTTP